MSPFKNLYIVRHGKSINSYDNSPDIDRPLKEKGIHDGYTIAERLLDKNIIPDKIVTSPAIRAIHSATIFARTLGFQYQEIAIIEEIYNAEPNTILDIIKQTSNDVNSLMLFGHNPTFSDVAKYFLGNEIDSMPTTSIVGLKFNTKTWQEIENLEPIESFFDYPKKRHKT